MTLFGVEQLLAEPKRWIRPGCRYGLVCNQASVTHELEHSRIVLRRLLGDRLVRLFSPQHGFFAEEQDNMIESPHRTDPVTGLQVYSLYSETRRPTAEMLEGLDVLLVDLQDVGTRVYTFVSTLIECMFACADAGIQLCVLDRPNPIGRACEGPVLADAYRSFVGYLPVPLRHGMTIGELALMARDHFHLNVSVAVVPLAGWHGQDWWQAPWPWVLPSPNLPTPESCLCYAGTVLLEGTCLSEGRGTTKPFEIIGAPFVDPYALIDAVGGPRQPGCTLRAHYFVPTFNKWAGRRCGGLQIHVLHRDRFRPFELTVRLLDAVRTLWPDEFAWASPPYEYDYERQPIDLIAGTDRLRHALEAGTTDALLSELTTENDAFRARRAHYELYSPSC